MPRKLQLTKRQLEVLELAASGLTFNEIGERLGISGRTVSIHADMMRRMLGANSIAHAVNIGWLEGILKQPVTLLPEFVAYDPTVIGPRDQ